MDSTVKDCDSILEEGNNQTLLAITEYSASNKVVISEAEQYESRCRVSKNIVLQSVEGWVNENLLPVPFVDNRTMCTPAMRNETKSLVVEISG